MPTRRRKVRFVSVLAIQRLPPEKIVELFDQLNRGEVILISIYPDKWAKIGLESPKLENFTHHQMDLKKSRISKIMAELSKEWLYEDEKRIHRRKKQKNSKIIQAFQKTWLHI